MGDPVETAVERLVERAGTSYFGKYRGIVTDVEDPLNRCRIRASVPAVLGEHPCGWAMPALPFAGAGHGMVVLPAVGSGVWIEFEAGRLDSPIWSGGWWAADQRPDPQGSKVRVFVSEGGHRIVFDDERGEVTVAHGGGPSIRLTASEIVLSAGSCELKIGETEITLNNGLLKVGLSGVSLVNGAMAVGTP
jgi:hypothetical protein